MMNTTKNSDCTILVCSCDKYADVLWPFAKLWRKFWPDCPFETVLVTESEIEDKLCFDRVIACGVGDTWCNMLVRALDEIKTPYVMLLCNDYYLTEKVDSAKILKRLDDAKRLCANNLRLIPNPSPARARAEKLEGEDNLYRYPAQSDYCVATQAGFWRREYLRALASRQKSAWEFERFGSFDPITAEKPLLVTGKKEFPFVDAVHKGYWEKSGLAACKENGIDISSFKRTLPPFKIKFIEGLKSLIFAVVPTTLLVKFQNRFSLGAIETPGVK